MKSPIHLYSTIGTPWLTPDWRWRLATKIMERGGYATVKRDGQLVQRVVRYTRLLDRAWTDRGTRRAAKEYPDVFLAMKLLQEPSMRMLELRARVLAGESDRTIARQLGFPAHGVTTFVALFFDVRPRINARSWIRRVAIDLPLDEPPSVESLFLLHAWHRGSEVIGPWLDYLQHQEERHDWSTVVGRQRAWIEQFIGVQQLPFDAQTLRSLWKLSLFSLGKSPKTVRSATVEATVSRNRAQILGEIGWSDAGGAAIEESGKPQPIARDPSGNKLGEISRAG